MLSRRETSMVGKKLDQVIKVYFQQYSWLDINLELTACQLAGNPAKNVLSAQNRSLGLWQVHFEDHVRTKRKAIERKVNSCRGLSQYISCFTSLKWAAVLEDLRSSNSYQYYYYYYYWNFYWFIEICQSGWSRTSGRSLPPKELTI